MVFGDLFSSKYCEAILFYVLMNGSCYGTEVSQVFETSLSPIQSTLDKLENSGVFVSQLVGKTRVYQFNPRYPFLVEMQELLKKAYSYIPDEVKELKYEQKTRKRPRRKGKPL